ncbi:hypothetical protein EI42_05984 [Thermosporothrix hazakensis]|jgi:hypothetical protein|uniref:Uncharacterized protein n=1 Tax=Thermosporothrix hazakensis TaxID=644383 RepID=A0A326TVP3_THEHA|nr:hypothetical protein [Thermosporothrix hazakensis]PZW19675.1 hypothetical protein EI42_05984 [Thermosporothrix hazakensis]GCE49213.1 hypothetical protein KTH_40820 [Thermosporothrix hazakensis]
MSSLDQQSLWVEEAESQSRPKRAKIPPLARAEEIYRELARLKVGDSVPSKIYICDYTTREIPPWKVVRLETLMKAIKLTVVDPESRKQDLIQQSWIALDIFALPTKTLATPLYTYREGASPHCSNMLRDIRQRARQLAEQITGVKVDDDDDPEEDLDDDE